MAAFQFAESTHCEIHSRAMIPLIGYLLCVYLVFKGFEIFQIAHSNPNAPSTATVFGIIAFVASIAIAILFALLLFVSSSPISVPQI